MPEIRPFTPFLLEPNPHLTFEEFLFTPKESVQSRIIRNSGLNILSSVHLTYPSDASVIQSTQEKLLELEILKQQKVPCVMPYAQYYVDPFNGEQKSRVGLLCHVPLSNNRAIQGHEQVFPSYVEEKKEILERTSWNTLPTYGLYRDPMHSISSLLDRALRNPSFHFIDPDDVEHRIAHITDSRIIQEIATKIEPFPVIIGDGHHRHAALSNWQKQHRKPVCELMYLCNYERNAPNIHPFFQFYRSQNPQSSWSRLTGVFDIEQLTTDKSSLFSTYFHHTKLCHKGRFYLLKAGKSNFSTAPAERIANEKKLFGKVFENESLSFPSNPIGVSNDWHEVEETFSDQKLFTVIPPGHKMDQVETVVQSGGVFPPKSTYFYPKPLSGFLFSPFECDV